MKRRRRAISRAWHVANRAPAEYRAAVESDLADEFYAEGFAVSWSDLLETVYDALSDAAQMELVCYARFTDDLSDDGVLLEVRTPSVGSAVCGLAALQGIDKTRCRRIRTTSKRLPMFDFNPHEGEEEERLAALDARRRESEETVAERPGLEEAVRNVRASEPASPARARSVLESSEAVLACPHAAELLRTSYHDILAGRAVAYFVARAGPRKRCFDGAESRI